MGHLGVRVVLAASLMGLNGCGGEVEKLSLFAARAHAAVALAWVTTFTKVEDERPSPPQPDQCENCNGTGEIGDGAGISVTCPECDGTGVRSGFQQVSQPVVPAEEAHEVEQPAPVAEPTPAGPVPVTICENGTCRVVERSVIAQRPVRRIVTAPVRVMKERRTYGRRPVRRFFGRLCRRCR